MKKLLVAFLVLATVFAYAGNDKDKGKDKDKDNNNNTTVTTPAEPKVTDLYKYYDGVFKITQDGTLSLTYYSPDSKYGQVTAFGYFKVGNPDEKFLLDDKLTGNETVKIENLKAGDEIAFYMQSKKGGDNLTIYSTNVTQPNSTTYFTVTDYGYTFGDTKWDKGVLAWKEVTTVNSPETAPSGQPLPGALTTMLIAGGCAAYLKRRKSARK